MDKNTAKDIIVEVLQKSLAGQLDPSSNINPKNIADAIAVRVNFEKTFQDSKNDNFIGTLVDYVNGKWIETDDELNNLTEDEKLLKNFIRGKITAYEEILEVIKSL